MKILVLFGLVALVKCNTYEPGTPGASWTPEVATIIRYKNHNIFVEFKAMLCYFFQRNKLFHLWRKDILMTNVQKFDLMIHDGPDGNPGYTDYLYEPDRRLSKVDCNLNEMMCRTSWLPNTRLDDISFTPSKAIRLAFHDCQPYIDGTGGCDGCINFEENVVENDVLQHSVAILVSFGYFCCTYR